MQTWFYIEEAEEVVPGSAREWTFDTIPEEWTLLSSQALTRGPDGRWTSVSAGAPRIFYHPINLIKLGTMVEPAATNYVHKARSPEWIATNCTVSTETMVSPFGNGPVLRIQPNSAPSNHYLALPLDGSANRGTTPPENIVYTYTLVIKSTGFERLALTLKNRAGVTSTVSYDLTGSVITQNSAIGRIFRDTDSFWQLELSTNIGLGAAIPQLEMHFEQSNGNRVFTGSDSSFVHIAYCGLENNPEATSPVVSNGSSPVTRSADILTSVPSWMRLGPYAFGISWAPLFEPSNREATTLMLGGGNDYARLYSSSQSTWSTLVDNSAIQANLTASAPFRLGLQTNVVSAAPNAFFFAHNGDTISSDPSGTLPRDFSLLRIGANTDGSVAGSMVIDRIRYWAQDLTITQTKDLSSVLTMPGDTVDAVSIQSEISAYAVLGEVVIPVVRSKFGAEARVSWLTEDGTAVSGIDYSGAAGTATFELGEPVTFISIPLTDIGASELRTFRVRLANPVDVAVGTALCTVTIVPYLATATPIHDAVFGPTLPDGWLVSRSQSGWQRNSAGVWSVVGANQPRFLESVTSGGGEFSTAYSTAFAGFSQQGVTTPGLLIERAGRNRLADSVKLSNGAGVQGTLSGISTVSAGTIPIGTRVVSFRENTTNAEHYYSQALTSGTGDALPDSPVNYYYSVMLKPIGGLDGIELLTSALNNTFPWVRFSLSLVGVQSTSGDNVFNPRIERCPGFPGVYRLGFGFNSATGSTSLTLIVQTLEAGGIPMFTGRGSGVGFDLYHNQLEDGSDWTSPIETTGTALQRDADILEPSGGWQIDTNRTWAFALRGGHLSPKPDTQVLADIVSDQGDTVALVATPSTVPNVHADAVISTVAHFPVSAGNLLPGSAATFLLNTRSTAIDVYRDGALQGTVPAALASTTIRLGGRADGSDMGAMVVDRIRFWLASLNNDVAALFSANIAATPPTATSYQPIVSLPTTLLLSEVGSGGVIEDENGDPIEGGSEGGVGALTLTKIGDGACSVQLSTVVYTATTADYTPIANQVVSFGVGETQKKVDLVITQDALDEGVEAFTVVISNPTGCALGNAVCSVSII